MNIKFNSIEINNFLSIGQATINLNDKGYCFINGINNCKEDNAKSNGAGKSSIADAILWTITGETSRGIKDINNIYVEEGTYTILNMLVDNKEYKLIRSKNHSKYKTDLRIYIDNEDKSGKGIRDSEQLLKQYLPDLTNQLLSSVILLGQGLPQRFSNNTPSKRKEILEQLSKSDFMIEDIKERINKRKEELTNNQKELDNNISSTNGQIKILEEQINENEKELNNMPQVIDYKNKIEENKKIISEKEEENKEKEEQVNNIELIKERHNNILIETIAKAKDYEKDEEIILLDNEVKSLREKLIELKSTADNIKKQYEQYDNVKDICPTCKQKLPNIFKIDTTDLHNEYDNIMIEYNNVVANGKSAKEKYDSKVKEYTDKNIADTNMVKENINKCSNEINMLKTNIQSNKIIIDKMVKENDESNNFINNYVQKTNQLKQNIENDKNKIQKRKFDLENFTTESDKNNAHIEVIKKFETLVKRDFRGYLLSGVVDYINNKAKEYCLEIFGTDKISFGIDGNNLDIKYNNKIYESLSGGEKQKIDIIIQFSLRDMLCKFMNFSSNIIVLDEIFDNLDSVGVDNILNLISNKLNDLNSIYIISHHTDISIPYDSTITVVKDVNGISTIYE